MTFGNGVKNIQAAAYNGARTVYIFSENSGLMYGLYSRAASNQERLMMARVRYVLFDISLILIFYFFIF